MLLNSTLICKFADMIKRFYFKCSLFDKRTQTWDIAPHFPRLTMFNDGKTFSQTMRELMVIIRNEMSGNKDYYQRLHEQLTACKWSIFSVMVDDNGRFDYNTQKLLFTISTEVWLRAKKYFTLRNIEN